MARYIDADKMREDWLEDGENEYVYDANSVLESIDRQPTADVVEVVRCKECVHWGGVTFGFICRKFSSPSTKICMGADCYCSYGEKKDETTM